MGINRIFQKVGLIGGGARSRRRKKRGRARSAGTLPTVGRYFLEEPIGRGAFGEVWRAVDPHINRPVAVKILNIPKGLSPQQKDDWEKRFLREARAAGMLSDPGIVTIHDVGMAEDGRPFIVMELIEGVSLDAIISNGPLPRENTALHWGAQVAEALHAAHRRGVVHRDVKPANVLIDREGRARIADFGIARLAESDLTHEGLFLGSPAFASPEQIRGGTIDGRSDLFSLGATLYTLLSGERPFAGEDLMGLAYAICSVEPAPLRRGGRRFSPECEAVISKALAKDPGQRYQAGEDLALDLREVVASRPPRQAQVPKPAETTLVETGRQEAAGGAGAGSRRARREPRGGARRASPRGGAAVAVALLLALASASIGGYLLMGRFAGQPARSEMAGAAPPAPRSHDVWHQAGEAETAVVTVHVVHGVPEGTLTIRSGPRRLLRAPLEPPGAGADASGQASAEWRLRLPEGTHHLSVVVDGGRAGMRLEGEQSPSVRGGQRYRLHIRVKDRPSPKLDLMWTDD